MYMRFGVKSGRLLGARRYAVVCLALAVAGIATLLVSKAASNSTSLYANNGAKQGNVTSLGTTSVQFGKTGVCGKRVQNYTYQVPFGNAVWNQPVCGLPVYAKSADYVNRFYSWSSLNNGTADPNDKRIFGFVNVDIGLPKPSLTDPEGLSGLFSRNVYYASDATTTTQVQASVYESNLDGIKLDDGQTPDAKRFLPNAYIPWNPNWRTGEGGDNEIVLLDNRPGPTQGRIYEISGYKRDLAAVTQCGPLFRDRICTYTVRVGRDTQGNIIDYRTYEGFLDGRGVGLSMFATFTTPEEVMAGEIRHALGMAIPNTAVGPVCTALQLGTPAEGYTCGTAVAPATKVERGSSTSSAYLTGMSPELAAIYTLDKLIPEGMRFALNITDSQIEAWIQSQSKFANDTKKANTARIFARALRDYGVMVVDTNGAKAQLQLAGSANPVARQQWASVGLDTDDDKYLLEGLITKSNLYVVNPPQLTCLDGSVTRYFCDWTTARYP